MMNTGEAPRVGVVFRRQLPLSACASSSRRRRRRSAWTTEDRFVEGG